MPLVKASRSPRVCSWRGRKRSWARIEASTGKPLKAVLAARIRMSPVAAMVKKNAGEKFENTEWASWPMTVCWS